MISNLSGSDERATGIGLQPNGKVVITGLVRTTTGYDFALACDLSNGALDPTFSSNGWLTLDLYAGNDSGMALVMLPGGPLVLAGYADNGTDYDFALVQYR